MERMANIAANHGFSFVKVAIIFAIFSRSMENPQFDPSDVLTPLLLSLTVAAQMSIDVSFISRVMAIFVSWHAFSVTYKYLPIMEEVFQRTLMSGSDIFKPDPTHFESMFASRGWLLAALPYVFVAATLSCFLYVLFMAARETWREIHGEIALNDSDMRLQALSPSSNMETNDSLETRDTKARRPKLTFASLTGMIELKTRLREALEAWRKNGKNGILFYGEPGTGKTAFAEAIAGELKLPIMKVNFSSFASRWVNQSTEQFLDIVAQAKQQAPCVLFMDEVDSIIPRRETIARGDSEDRKVITTFLNKIEELRNSRVLVIAATNHYDQLDSAAIRHGRFDFHIEVPLPDAEARRGLIQHELSVARMKADENTLAKTVKRWGGFNVPRIRNATEAACKLARERGSDTVEIKDFFDGLRKVQGNQAGVPEDALSFDELYLDESVRRQLSRLATTFKHVYEIEEKGGDFPGGVVFYGPPGTGKTAMAKALAKASGWTFIPTSGRELLEDGAIKRIARKASDLRPSIVFIDEADDILCDRSMSVIKPFTNELLTIMSGAGMELHDVVWIAATNDIDAFDEAALRRFNIKIELPIPGIDTIRDMVRGWAARHVDKIANGDPDAWAQEVAKALEGLAPANIERILKSALNNEIADAIVDGTPVQITVDDVIAARMEMKL